MSKNGSASKSRRLAGPAFLFLIFGGAALFFQDILEKFGEEAVSQTKLVLNYGVQIGIWLASAWLVNRVMAIFFWEGLIERATGQPVPRLMKDILAFVIFLVALTGIVSFVFGGSVTGIWATGGALGFIIGFALRSMILDVFSGLAVNIDRAYRIGDWVMVHQRSPEVHIIGCVLEINWRTTRLKTTDNNMVVIPNSVMGMAIVTNFMRPEPISRLELYFTFDYSVPSARVIRVLEGAVMAITSDKGVKAKPKPKVRITRVSNLGTEYRVRYWVIPADLSPNKSRHIVVTSVLKHLQQSGLTLAYPKRDVFHTEMPQRQLDSGSELDIKRLLRRIELFKSIDEDEVQLLADGLERREYKSGRNLIERGADGNSMFVLVEGLVYVYADIKGDGTEVKVAQIIPGQFFGEMSLLTGEARSATITAASSAVAYEIPKSAMTELFGRRPELAEEISHVVAARKLRNLEAASEKTSEELAEQKTSMAGEILGKIRSFFGGVF